MTRRRLIALLAILLLGALVFYLAHPSEPSYQGRRLSAWIMDFDDAPIDPTDSAIGATTRFACTRALRAIGTNAVPTLLNWLQAPDTPTKTAWNSFLLQNLHTHFRFRTGIDQQTMAVSGFRILGDTALPAVPTLTKLLESPDAGVRFRSLRCLSEITHDRTVLLPVLLQTLKNPDRHLSLLAATCLHNYYPDEAETARVYSLYPEIKLSAITTTQTNLATTK